MSKPTLADRLRQQTNSAPDMNPVESTKQKRDAEILPDMQEVITDPAVRSRLITLVLQDAELGIGEKAIKKERRPVKEAIKKLLGFKQIKFMCDGNRVVGYSTPRKFVDPELLMANGVLPSVISASTRIKESYTLKITPPGAREDEDDD